MSRASAAVLFRDGTIKYAIYNGTSDILIPALFDSMESARDDYRSERPSPWVPDDLLNTGGPVRIYSAYGYGFEWEGTATRDYVTSELDYMEIEEATRYGRDTQPLWLRWDGAVVVGEIVADN